MFSHSRSAKEKFHLGEEQKKLVLEQKLFLSEDKISHALRVLEKKLSIRQNTEKKRIKKILTLHFVALKSNMKDEQSEKKSGSGGY